MSIFYSFFDRAELYSCEGKSDEYIVTTRRGKTESATVMNSIKQALLQDDTTYVNGDLITNKTTDIKYFLVGLQESTDAIQGQIHKINALVDIVSLKETFDSAKKSLGYAETSLYSETPVVVSVVAAGMHLYDPGLLPTTTIKFITRDITVQTKNRIKFNDVNYQIDAINNIKYESMLEIQCTADTRKTAIC